MYVPDPFKDVIRPVTEVHPKLTHGPRLVLRTTGIDMPSKRSPVSPPTAGAILLRWQRRNSLLCGTQLAGILL